MERSQFNIIIKSQAGIGYVAILVLLAILSTMGLAFMHKVGLMSSVTLNRRTSMQAHYLAESAANQALWRMLNDPGFTPESDKYCMHSLGDGRYGYKVRRPTETTFATVATVGAIGDSVVDQSYVQYIIPSNVLTAYARTTTPAIQYRRLIGANWTDPADTPDIPVPTVYWVDVEGCPVRKEIIMGSIEGQDDINFVVWDGASWGNPHVFSTVNAGTGYKRFDVAYESQSGRALVVGRYDDTTTVRYNVWDGTAWLHATAQPAFNLAGGAARLVVMASCPGNDQILIATVNSLFDLQLFLWNGSAFTDLGIIETSTHNDQPGAVEIVYEQQSGDALVIWTIWGATPKFRVWNGVTLGPENIVPIFPNDVYFLRAAGDPTSDHIVVAGVDKFYDVQVGIWDGTAWADSREVETDNANQVRQGVDVAWEAAGEDALVVWAPWNSGVPTVRSLAWRKGTALADSTVQEGPDAQNQPWLVRLLPISQSEKIVLLVETNTNDLRYSLWDGERLKGDPGILLESDISVQNELAFDLAEADVPRTGGTGSGWGVNQPPVVDAGTDQTINLPTNEANLDGTVTDDGLPDPPATVTTTWSVVSGPGTVNFDDSSLVDTVARFSEAGTYVLRLTADDFDLNNFGEVTIIVDSSPVLFVSGGTGDPIVPTATEQLRIDLIESWGFGVTLILANAPQADYDAALADVDVVFISSDISSTDLGTKLTAATVGVLSEDIGLVDEFGIAEPLFVQKVSQSLNIIDNTHYVTSGFDLGALAIYSYAQNVWTVSGALAPGLQILGETQESGSVFPPGLAVLETGAELYGGGFAPGRRVQLPWKGGSFDFNSLNANGRTIFKRALEWGAAWDGGPLLFVVGNATTLSSKDSGRKALMESWGYSVTLIDDGDSQANFDAAAAAASVVYVSGTIGGGTLLDKLTGSPTPIVNEFPGKLDNFGFCSTANLAFSADTFAKSDPALYITSPFGGNSITVLTTFLLMPVPGGTLAPDLQAPAGFTATEYAVVTLDTGAKRWDGNPAPARRAHLPFAPAETTQLTSDGKTVMQRAIEWAASGGGGGASDTDPPTPDPMTWASPPVAVDVTSITMTATTASDPSGVQYYFECTAGGGNDSGWQSSSIYVDSGLSPETQYTYRVKVRDRSANYNETEWSFEISATTLSNVIYVQDIAMGYRTQGVNYYGQATVWIKGVDGTNISGALVSGNWSGAVSGSSMGNTGSDGKVMLESAGKKNGGTFTFTVTSVVKTGYTYNSSLNVEDSDTIIVP